MITGDLEFQCQFGVQLRIYQQRNISCKLELLLQRPRTNLITGGLGLQGQIRLRTSKILGFFVEVITLKPFGIYPFKLELCFDHLQC